MARDFGGDLASDRVEVADFAAMRNLDTFSTSQWVFRTGSDAARLWEKGDAGAGTQEHNSDVSGTQVDLVARRWSTTIGIWIWTTPPTLNAWDHFGITYDYSSTTNDPVMYIDGVDQGAPDSETTPVGTVETRSASGWKIGNSNDATRAFDGRVAEFALWNVVLSSNDMRSLSAGVSPTRIRPSALLIYTPIFGIDSPEPNYTANADGTVTGTTQANHAPVAPSFGFDFTLDQFLDATHIRDALGMGIIPFVR